MRLEIPYITSAIYWNDSLGFYNKDIGLLPVGQLQTVILRSVLDECLTLSDLCESFPSANAADHNRTKDALVASIRSVGLATCHVELAKRPDIIVVDRGWGGVSQHTAQLWAALNERWDCLLLSPTGPPFGYDTKLSKRNISMKSLDVDSSNFTSFISVVRSLVKNLKPKLIFLGHRSIAPYLFDIMALTPTILYGDNYAEGTLAIGPHLQEKPPLDSFTFVQQLHHGAGLPWQSLDHVKAMYWSFARSRQIWFWSEEQKHSADLTIPALKHKFRVVLPAVDERCFECAPGHEDTILFTTTSESSAIGSKGLDPLLKVFGSLPTHIKLLIVVADGGLVRQVAATCSRIEVQESVSKEAMLSIYERTTVNCRISTGDTSPVSVLESMAAGNPVIVSAEIARHVPCIQDGITGFVVEPANLSLLARRLLELFENGALRDRMGGAARAAVENLKMSKCVNLITDLMGANDESTSPCTGCQ